MSINIKKTKRSEAGQKTKKEGGVVNMERGDTDRKNKRRKMEGIRRRRRK